MLREQGPSEKDINFSSNEKENKNNNKETFRHALDFLLTPEELFQSDFPEQIPTTEVKDLKHAENLEIQKWKKMGQAVIDRMNFKLTHPLSKESKDIKVLVVIMGGGMSGVYGAGQMAALLKIGYLPSVPLQSTPHPGIVTNQLYGISAGAGTVLYGAAGYVQGIRGASIFYEECTTKNFINFLRFNKVMDVGWLVKEPMARGKKKLEIKTVLDNPVEVYLQVTDPKDGNPYMVNAKTVNEGMLEAAHASMAVPWLYGGTPKVNGKEAVDGAIEPLPLEMIITKFQPTDVVILPNRSYQDVGGFKLSLGEKVMLGFARLLPQSSNSVFIKKYLEQKIALRKSFEYMAKHTSINFLVVWPPNMKVGTITTNSSLLKSAVFKSAIKTCQTFGHSSVASEFR